MNSDPSGRPTAGLILTPGASATRDHSQLVALDDALTALGVFVERIDLPRTSSAPRHVRAITEAAGVLAERSGLATDRIFLGGRSLGGRMCSMAVAEGLPAAGLLLVSYPLHPPGRPEKSRAGHFPAIRVPTLFVSGTKDAFGTPGELEAASASLSGEVFHFWVHSADHGLRGKDGVVAEAATQWMAHRLPNS